MKRRFSLNHILHNDKLMMAFSLILAILCPPPNEIPKFSNAVLAKSHKNIFFGKNRNRKTAFWVYNSGGTTRILHYDPRRGTR